MTDTLPLLLPTVPGKAHGIVSLDPPTVQCDACAATYTAPTLARAVRRQCDAARVPSRGFHHLPDRTTY